MDSYHRTKLFSIILLIVTMAISFSVLATADGPDYFELKSPKPIGLYKAPHLGTEPLSTIPLNAGKLKNLGCSGIVSFKEWQKMTENQRAEAKNEAWCRVMFKDIKGWVQLQFLQEYSDVKTPQFDCKKATHEAEIAICKDPELMALDNKMSQTYSQALKRADSIPEIGKQSLKLLKAAQRGWVKGRNDCWKSQSKIKQCIQSNYKRRITYLQAKYVLVKPLRIQIFTCDDYRDEITLTWYDTDLYRSIALERGDKTKMFIADDDENPKLFKGEFGTYLSFNKDNVTVLLDQFKAPKTCKFSRNILRKIP